MLAQYFLVGDFCRLGVFYFAMLVAIISDIHDRLDHLQQVLERINAHGCQRLLFAGDFCAPFSLAAIVADFGGEIDCVFGNNDGDQLLLASIAAQHPQVTLHGAYALMEIDGKKLAMYHYPELAAPLAKSGEYALVVCGHTHKQQLEAHGDCILVNPGEVMGRWGQLGYALWDTQKHTVELQQIALR